MKLILLAAFTASLSLVPNAFAQATNPLFTPREAEDTNLLAYVILLRADGWSEKITIMGVTLNLNDEQGMNFCPTYRGYDREFQKLNDKNLFGIKEYAENYDSTMDENGQNYAKPALELESQRNDLNRPCYHKVSAHSGGVNAGLSLQVETQPIVLIDLETESSLPIGMSSTEIQ